MFCGATSFNQSLNKWDVSKVTDMDFMFDDASSFNQPLDDWNVSKVKNMRHMFCGVFFLYWPITIGIEEFFSFNLSFINV